MNEVLSYNMHCHECKMFFLKNALHSPIEYLKVYDKDSKMQWATEILGRARWTRTLKSK